MKFSRVGIIQISLGWSGVFSSMLCHFRRSVYQGRFLEVTFDLFMTYEKNLQWPKEMSHLSIDVRSRLVLNQRELRSEWECYEWNPLAWVPPSLEHRRLISWKVLFVSLSHWSLAWFALVFKCVLPKSSFVFSRTHANFKYRAGTTVVHQIQSEKPCDCIWRNFPKNIAIDPVRPHPPGCVFADV